MLSMSNGLQADFPGGRIHYSSRSDHYKGVSSPTDSKSQSGNAEKGFKELSGHSHNDTAEGTSTIKTVAEGGIDANLKRLEDDIFNEVKAKLNNIQPEMANLYYRLAPAKAPQGTPLNDGSAPHAALDATLYYPNDPRVITTIDGIVKQIPEVVSSF